LIKLRIIILHIKKVFTKINLEKKNLIKLRIIILYIKKVFTNI